MFFYCLRTQRRQQRRPLTQLRRHNHSHAIRRGATENRMFKSTWTTHNIEQDGVHLTPRKKRQQKGELPLRRTRWSVVLPTLQVSGRLWAVSAHCGTRAAAGHPPARARAAKAAAPGAPGHFYGI